MKKPVIIALMGSPRDRSNTDILTDIAIEHAEKAGASVHKFSVSTINIEPCIGCLRCNMLGKCANTKDAWTDFAFKWREADGLLLAAPVYFHGIPGQMKCILDRFRSFLHVKMGMEKLDYGSRPYKAKNAAIILVQGEPSGDDYRSALDTLEFFVNKMCGGLVTGHLVGTSLAVRGQINMTRGQLAELGEKMGWSEDYPDKLIALYQTQKAAARDLGRALVESLRK